MKTIALKFIQQYISQGGTALILLGFSVMHALVLFVLPNDYNILQGEFADLEEASSTTSPNNFASLMALSDQEPVLI